MQHIPNPIRLFLALAALLLSASASGQDTLLSIKNVAEFRASHACPMTGLVVNECPGWVVRLITPECAGGRDNSDNMRWITSVDAEDEAGRRDCPVAPQ